MEYKIYTKKDIQDNKDKLRPGNILVTHGTDLYDRLIQLFTKSEWNHAALITDSFGSIIELSQKGIIKQDISAYKNQIYHIIDLKMSDEDRLQAVKYANVMLKRHEEYGFLTIASIAFKIITKSRLVVKLDGTLICSEFVANALSEGGIIWDKDTSLITPADLYNLVVQNKPF